jgi:hypothetical protein
MVLDIYILRNTCLYYVLHHWGNADMVTYHDRPDLYFLSNYGSCRLDKCMCVDGDNPRYGGSWGGLACPDWVPHGAADMKSLIEDAKNNYMRRKNEEKAKGEVHPQ